MKGIVRWAIANAPGMNTLVVALLLVGLFSLFSLRRETFPEFELEVILVTVPYPGADPEEVESAICQKIEEAVSSIAGIKEMTSIAQENAGSVVLELETNVPNVEKVLNEVRSEVDRISTFPVQAEDPEVKQITFRDTAIKLAVLGPEQTGHESDIRLREITESVREDLLQLEEITQAEIQGAREYEIDIEIPEETLRRYGLELREVAGAVRRENLDLPAGLLKSPSQDVMLKGENKRITGEEIQEIPLITDPNGVVLSIGDIAKVYDGFADTTSITRINGQPALVIEVQKTSDEDLIVVTDAVKEFAKSHEVPNGYRLLPWDDRSIEVQDRIELLAENALQGLVLVFLVLALFLDLRLACWVALGIPISFLGACILLLMFGQTINMLSLFGFLMVIGILVDDGIVVGENIHTHRERGESPLDAAINGTLEVLPSVFAAVATTVIAFLPLMFIAGVMGKFVAILPGAAIACLCISLFESTMVLPVHLREEAHTGNILERALFVRDRMAPLWCWTVGSILVFGAAILRFLALAIAPIKLVLQKLNPIFSRSFDTFASKVYSPVLRGVIHNPGLTIATAVSILLFTAGIFAAGIVRWEFFPKFDMPRVEASIVFPDGTPENITKAAVDRLTNALNEVDEKHIENGKHPVKIVQESVGYVTGQGTSGQRTQSSGSHLAKIEAELTDTSERSVKSDVIVNEWREAAGDFPGAESVTFQSPAFGPAGRKIEFKLLAPKEQANQLDVAVEQVKDKLASFPGVFDVDDDSRPGKPEIQIDLKPTAIATGVQRADLFETVRAAYFGEEVMRVQRGRHEIKIMVRLPKEDRRSFANFDELRVRTTDPATGELVSRPILELADISVGHGPSEINRIDRMRSITIYSDVDETIGSTEAIVGKLKETELPKILKKFPGLKVLWKGQQQQQAESNQSMMVGMVCAILGMFGLLTIEFKSYLQPILILMIIPFGIVGAIWGHWVLGIPISFFSMMGIVALTGVVVNDSIVLVDFINMKLREGLTLNESLYEAGMRRIRPVFLTSATTVVGLMPMVFETSFQAQLLVPMAAAICFGLMLTTGLILLLLPAVYATYGGLVGIDRDPASFQEPVLNDARKPMVVAGDREFVAQNSSYGE